MVFYFFTTTRYTDAVIFVIHSCYIFADVPFDLTSDDCNEQPKSAQASPLLASSVAPREGTPSNDIDKKTPKRANLITLGFKRIPKPGSSSESKDEIQGNLESGHKPRRIHFVTLQGDMKGMLFASSQGYTVLSLVFLSTVLFPPP